MRDDDRRDRRVVRERARHRPQQESLENTMTSSTDHEEIGTVARCPQHHTVAGRDRQLDWGMPMEVVEHCSNAVFEFSDCDGPRRTWRRCQRFTGHCVVGERVDDFTRAERRRCSRVHRNAVRAWEEPDVESDDDVEVIM